VAAGGSRAAGGIAGCERTPPRPACGDFSRCARVTGGTPVRQTGRVPPPSSVQRPIGLAITLVVLGAIGLVSSLALTFDKIALLENPAAPLSCNFSVLVSCGANLNSAQGEVFGFPNSILGLMFWSAVIVVGVGVLAGARFDFWFWIACSAGATAAFIFVVWFIAQSIFVLGVLCPWCMVTWLVTIPLFFVVLLHTLRSERCVPKMRTLAAGLFGWIPLMTLACYLVVAVLAQVNLDVLAQLG
jgi:uncharacterized membrane protein